MYPAKINTLCIPSYLFNKGVIKYYGKKLNFFYTINSKKSKIIPDRGRIHFDSKIQLMLKFT